MLNCSHRPWGTTEEVCEGQAETTESQVSGNRGRKGGQKMKVGLVSSEQEEPWKDAKASQDGTETLREGRQ